MGITRVPTRVLVVGQTPPPFGGQAVMIEQLLQGGLEGVELHHVRMAFSDEMDEIGRFRLAKLGHLAGLVARIAWARIRHRTPVLYYPPAGPNRLPLWRDLVVLLATRWLFRRTVFHFHAGGLTDWLPELTPAERLLAWLAYGAPDCAIRPSALDPPDGERLGARADRVIPHGIPDVRGSYPSPPRTAGAPPRILFAGVLCESKGVGVLLEAAVRLQARGVDFELDLMGRFGSPEFEAWTKDFLARKQLDARVRLLGVLTGADKWRAYAEADLFCLPSFFESESFGLVALEAMQFGLPVVATRWRGLPSLVADGESGRLVPIRDDGALADALTDLLRDADLRRRMGERGRARFERDFSLATWRERMAEALA